MPMWALVSKAFSHPSSQALKTLLSASFPANKALVPPGRLQSCRSTTSPRNPTPTHSPSSPPMPPLMWVKEKLPLTDEKHWSPSNILSSSVGDGGGVFVRLNQWDISAAGSSLFPWEATALCLPVCSFILKQRCLTFYIVLHMDSPLVSFMLLIVSHKFPYASSTISLSVFSNHITLWLIQASINRK